MMRKTTKYLFGVCIVLLVFNTGVFSQKKFLRRFEIYSTSIHTSITPPSNNVSHMAVDTSRGITSLWIGTGKGLAKSSNTGRSWIDYGSDPAFADPGIFAISSMNNTIIWAATGHDENTDGGSVQTGSGYAFSTNGGTSWQHLRQAMDKQQDSLLPYGIDTIWFLPVVVPEENVTFDVALTPGVEWISSWASGLRKSTDNGQHWQRIPLPPDNRNSIKPTDTLWTYATNDTLHQHKILPRFDPRLNNNFLAFSVYAADSNTLWCGTAGGVNKSTDGGQSWVKFSHQNQSKPILGDWVIAIRGQRMQNTLRIWTTNWVASDNAESYGVSYSDDSGSSWTNLLQGIRAYDFSFDSSICYIATDNGIFRTSDGGLSFTNFSNFDDPTNHQTITSPQVYTSAVVGDTVFIGTGDGVAHTIDSPEHPFGSQWSVGRSYVPLQSSSSTYAYPNPFSPGSEPIRIHYKLPNSGSTASHDVRIQIFDFGMNRVRTLINSSRTGSSDFDEIWNGLDDHQRMVANGVYLYRIDIDAQNAVFGKIIVLQ